jgi:16S rRNA (guanine527-N7)-methyltransferase
VSSVSDRVELLSRRFALPDGAAERLLRLMDLVAAAPISLTSVREPAQAVDIHVADSLAGLDVPELAAARTIADLGAGAGFPGLVLAIALPGAHVALVESVRKKADFLERAVADLGLENVAVVTSRAEGWVEGMGRQDVVTARALASLPVLLEYASPLLHDDGVLVAWKGRRDAGEEADGAAAATLLSMSVPEPRVVTADIVPGANDRCLYVSSKVGSTPLGYPRREGIARKSPLGTSSRG